MYNGNSYGQLFKVSTYGESHGEAIGCMIDGCPKSQDRFRRYSKDLDQENLGKPDILLNEENLIL